MNATQFPTLAGDPLVPTETVTKFQEDGNSIGGSQ